MKRVLWLLPLFMLLACGPTTSDFPAADATVPTDTAVSPSPESTEPVDETAVESSGPSAADLDDFSPATSPEEAAQTRPQDWQKGSTEPAIAIIEYGDFQ